VVQDPGTVQATFKTSDWNLAALAILPLGGAWDVFGKASPGWCQARLNSRFSGRSAQPAAARGTGPLLGLGVRWRFSGALGTRVAGRPATARWSVRFGTRCSPCSPLRDGRLNPAWHRAIWPRC
jgi:hypothetical protein